MLNEEVQAALRAVCEITDKHVNATSIDTYPHWKMKDHTGIYLAFDTSGDILAAFDNTVAEPGTEWDINKHENYSLAAWNKTEKALFAAPHATWANMEAEIDAPDLNQ